jgi:MFS transporter, putative metabolite:H+ symporter
MIPEKEQKSFTALIIVSALGYFVDVFDILIFGSVKTDSFREIGVPLPAHFSTGIIITNYQVLGMVAGGVIWGIMGDKRGRLSVLFGSILIYSVATIFNGFVENITTYKLCRFIAGFGLAGELGAGIAVVMETADRKKNYGPQIITGFGLLGAVAAGFLGEVLYWRTAYFTGGCMGLVLMLLRFSVRDSHLFLRQKKATIKGDFRLFFNNKQRFARYINCILIGMPAYFAIFLIQSAKELGAQHKLNTSSGKATIAYYSALALSDFVFTYLSTCLKSRKKVFLLLHSLSLATLLCFIYLPADSATVFYLKYSLFGISIGYWGLVVVNASEQFGTNIRNLAATTVPNFIRGSFYLTGISFTFLNNHLSLNDCILFIGGSLILVALAASSKMQDRFNNNLDYSEN